MVISDPRGLPWESKLPQIPEQDGRISILHPQSKSTTLVAGESIPCQATIAHTGFAGLPSGWITLGSNRHNPQTGHWPSTAFYRRGGLVSPPEPSTQVSELSFWSCPDIRFLSTGCCQQDTCSDAGGCWDDSSDCMVKDGIEQALPLGCGEFHGVECSDCLAR